MKIVRKLWRRIDAEDESAFSHSTRHHAGEPIISGPEVCLEAREIRARLDKYGNASGSIVKGFLVEECRRRHARRSIRVPSDMIPSRIEKAKQRLACCNAFILHAPSGLGWRL